MLTDAATATRVAMRQAPALGLAVLLSACGSFDVLLNPTAVQSDAQVNELGQGKPANIDAQGNRTLTPTGDVAEFVSHVSRYKTASLAASAVLDTEGNPAGQKAIDRYVDVGVTVGKIYCNLFFKELAISFAHRQFLRKEVNLVGGLTTAIMGVVGVSSGITGLTGAGFALADQSIDNFDANFLVSPQIATVQDLVHRAQKRAEDESLFHANNKPRSYPAAEAALNSYFELCNFNGVKRLVDESVKAGVPILRAGDSEAMRSIIALKQDIATALRLNVVSDAQIQALYRRFVATIDTPSAILKKAAATSQVAKDITAEFASLEKTFRDSFANTAVVFDTAKTGEQFLESVGFSPTVPAPRQTDVLLALRQIGQTSSYGISYLDLDKVYSSMPTAAPAAPAPVLPGVAGIAVAPAPAVSPAGLIPSTLTPLGSGRGSFSITIR